MLCKYCDSGRVIKYGKSQGQQCYLCKKCGHKFVGNGKFVKMKNNRRVIKASLDMYFEGLSFRKIQIQLRNLFDVDVDSATIYRWIFKYSKLAKEYVDTCKPQIEESKWHLDETQIRCRGEGEDKLFKWWWQLLDEDTRFLLANEISTARKIRNVASVFQKGKQKIKQPKKVFVDGFLGYEHGLNRVFSHPKLRPVLVSRVGIRARVTNNILERLHGTLKDRLRPMRGLKCMKSAEALLNGWQVYYNFIRPHSAIGGLTPAMKAGIDLRLENGWEDLIRQATKFQVLGY